MPNTTLTADPGSFTYTGNAATLRNARQVVAELGSLTFVGLPTGPTVLLAEPGSFAFTGNPAVMIPINSTPFYRDGVAEWSDTLGTTRPYVMGGQVPGNDRFYGAMPEGRLGLIFVLDGARLEIIVGRFVGPNLMYTDSILNSSNGGAAVSWPGRKILRLIMPS